jgi:formylglycine-generating enzyme
MFRNTSLFALWSAILLFLVVADQSACFGEISANVILVKGQMVRLDKGRSSGISPGDKVTIVRSGQKIASVKILSVQDKMAIGKITESSQPVQTGDRAVIGAVPAKAVNHSEPRQKSTSRLLKPDTPERKTIEVKEKPLVRSVGKSDIEFVQVKGDTFQMGDTLEEGELDEQPVHDVIMKDFKIGRTEVTVAQYREFCLATGRAMPVEPEWGWNDNDPIVNVTWNEAKSFCDWAGCRLPTEAEWEFAASGGVECDGYSFSGRDSSDDVSWYGANSDSKVHPVGEKIPNEIGILDMCGNVWEWCSDWYDPEYYTNSPGVNVKGPSSGVMRVIRGGCWDSEPGDCRTSNRSASLPQDSYNVIGFRCVK